jgi:uncharacterized protein YjbI with pentapeptide repeats
MGKNILTKELLLKSVEEWNEARKAYPDFKPDLRGADLCEANLSGADLNGVDLRDATLSGSNLSESNLCGANLRGANLGMDSFSRSTSLQGAILCMANLRGANFINANLSGADLRGANLIKANFSRAKLFMSDFSGSDFRESEVFGADFRHAQLSEANLSGIDLNAVNLSGANLSGSNLRRAFLSDVSFNESILSDVDFTGAKVGQTLFGGVDLRSAIGLETVKHSGPSTIGIDTIYASHGNIPEVFLRGCGVPDNFIEYARSLTAKAFDYYSCFISHSTSDNVFADRLYADLQAKGVRCWYAPHDMEGGEHVETQIDRAIKIHEKLLLVLSESSINSNWVKREITKAVKREDTEGKRVLFPISLVDFSKIEDWEFVDSKGRDLSEEIRKFYIPSFKGWENDNSLYTTEFDNLLKAFKDISKQ